jgi:Tol biopolymer transport system component
MGSTGPVRTVQFAFVASAVRWTASFLLITTAATVLYAQPPQPGATVAYTCARDGASPWPVEDVCIVRIDGSGLRNLTEDGHSHHPSWSPDGKRILFIHDAPLSAPPAYRETERTKTHHPIELSVMDADGTNRRVLRVIEPVIYSAAWSSDGNLLISASTSPSPGEPQRRGLFLLPADGKGELRFLRENGWTPAWSPDGEKIAFSVGQSSSNWTVHAASRNGSGDISLTEEGKVSGSPAWSPDGRTIAFSQSVDRREQIFVMNAEGSNIRQLTTDASWSCADPSWTPDGGHLVVGCRSAGACGGGSFSDGRPMPWCTRRLFTLPVGPGAAVAPVKLMDQDGATPSVAPR